MILLKDIVSSLLDSDDPSKAHQQAMQLGLDDMKFGRYGKDGVVTHVSTGGGAKLVPFTSRKGRGGRERPDFDLRTHRTKASPVQVGKASSPQEPYDISYLDNKFPRIEDVDLIPNPFVRGGVAELLDSMLEDNPLSIGHRLGHVFVDINTYIRHKVQRRAPLLDTTDPRAPAHKFDYLENNRYSNWIDNIDPKIAQKLETIIYEWTNSLRHPTNANVPTKIEYGTGHFELWHDDERVENYRLLDELITDAENTLQIDMSNLPEKSTAVRAMNFRRDDIPKLIETLRQFEVGSEVVMPPAGYTVGLTSASYDIMLDQHANIIIHIEPNDENKITGLYAPAYPENGYMEEMELIRPGNIVHEVVSVTEDVLVDAHGNNEYSGIVYEIVLKEKHMLDITEEDPYNSTE